MLWAMHCVNLNPPWKETLLKTKENNKKKLGRKDCKWDNLWIQPFPQVTIQEEILGINSKNFNEKLILKILERSLKLPVVEMIFI